MWCVMPCLFNAAYICLVTFPVVCEALFFFTSAFFSIVKLVYFDCLCFVRFLCGSLVSWFTCSSFGFCAYVFVGCFHHRSELLNSSRLFSIQFILCVISSFTPQTSRSRSIGSSWSLFPNIPTFLLIPDVPLYGFTMLSKATVKLKAVTNSSNDLSVSFPEETDFLINL